MQQKKLTKKQEQRAIDMFNAAMEGNLTLPSKEFDVLEAEFRKKFPGVFENSSKQRYLDELAGYIASLSEYDDRVEYVNSLEGSRAIKEHAIGLLTQGYMEVMLHHFPQLNPKYVEPVKPYDPFDL